MDEDAVIYIDRLRHGEMVELSFNCAEQLLEVGDPELQLVEPVRVVGRGYLADDQLIVQLTMRACLRRPCRICNRPVDVKLELHDLYWMQPVAEVKRAKVDCIPIVRELLLPEFPAFAECKQGSCPRRDELTTYQKEEEGYHPFKDLKE